ncbi:MAG: hypothetical protein N3E45_00460 [Oscillatoriaceae bacterium SKW80]|nr:hypothetical protein [Oscillatoriaceae bacterium SKYG93]MCX8119300.1 hypothetical protein [Oscillatoriaceae bacterium SKW80]MDW8454767.1 hypothetical protein [Oscillatoriaceae cyanobacterium SKYGB_i_bin93]HIK28452.1 hypothetical protein [Oscillatoriaceae cyanobacterium M7585_C2015_266]
MQKIQPSFSALTDRRHQRHWLEVAEYVSLVSSAVGTILAAASQQFVFAAAPLTLAVFLNFLNRPRIPKKTEPSDIASLDFDNDLYKAPIPAAIEQEIAHLHASLNSLQESTTAQVEEVYHYVDNVLGGMNLNAVHCALRELRTSAERLQKTALNQQDWETLNVRFLLLEEALAKLQALTPNMASPTTASKPQPSFTEALALLRAEQQAQHAKLQHRLAQLEQKNRAIIKPYLQRLVADVKQLRQQIASQQRPN